MKLLKYVSLHGIVACSAICSILFSSCEGEKVELDFDCSTTILTVNPVITNAACNQASGSVEITVSGGLEPYTFVLGTESNNTGLFTGLEGGSYSLTITDDNACSTTQSITITNADGVNFEEIVVNESGCGASNGNITATVTGGAGPYAFQLSDNGTSTDGVFTGLPSGSYELTVTDDNECSTTQSVDILSGISLEDDILPIITQNCAISGCHAGSQSPNLSTLENIVDRGDRILARTSAGTMPPSGKLSDSDISKISCWVNDGKPNN